MFEDIAFVQNLNIFYILDLLWTFAFAIWGAYKARSLGLNIFAVITLGTITAVGWGTIRDLILGRTPLFYIEDINYLLICIISGIITYMIPKILNKAYTIFRFIDSIWLAVFVIIWANIWLTFFLKSGDYSIIWAGMIATMLWMLTGVGWWVLRDTIIWQTPYAFYKHANYITAAFVGSSSYLIIWYYNIILWIFVSFILTMIYREVLSPFGIVKKLHLNKTK